MPFGLCGTVSDLLLLPHGVLHHTAEHHTCYRHSRIVLPPSNMICFCPLTRSPFCHAADRS